MKIHNLLTGFRWVDKYRIVPVPTSGGYQVPFTLTYLPGTNPYFLDIQPAIDDEPLPFWIEHASGVDYTTNTPFTSPKIWVRLPNGCKQIDIYRGNPRITTDRSNGDMVFDFFDDFNGGALDTTKWTQTSGTIAVSGSIVTITSTSYNTEQGMRGITAYGGNYAIRSRTQLYGGSTWYPYIGFSIANWGNGNNLIYRDINNLVGQTRNAGGAGYTNTTLIGAYDRYDIYETIRVGSPPTSTIFKTYGSTNTVSTTIPTDDEYPTLRAYTTTGAHGIHYTDWVAVRKYQSTEPTPVLMRQAEKNPYWRG